MISGSCVVNICSVASKILKLQVFASDYTILEYFSISLLQELCLQFFKNWKEEHLFQGAAQKAKNIDKELVCP